MNCFSKFQNALYFSSIDDISEDIWQSLECEDNVYFHRKFLKSFEKNHSEITFFHVVLIDKEKNPIAFAAIQIIDFYLDTIKNDEQVFLQKIKNIGRKLHIIPDKKPLKILISGNTFVSGEHGIFIKKDQNKKIIIKELALAILHLVQNDRTLNIDVFLLKDFLNESLFITNELTDFNYHPFSVEPNMVFKTDKNWQNFDDYLAAMKTKFRVKAKKAMALSKEITIENITKENIEKLLPKMTTLYQKVAKNATFKLNEFNLETYKYLKKEFGEQYILKAFCLDNNIVGFMSGIINNNSLDAHFVGIDYKLNKPYAIYQRMLYEYVQIAINKKLKTINFGRTASEIKSSVGAIPQDLTIYFRHKKSITNKILKLFLQRVQTTPFQQKFPFKNKITS